MDNSVSIPKSFLDPNQVTASFNIHMGDHVADFGAGHGYFTLPIARAVGNDGKVFAIDVQHSVLDIIRARARADHILNIEPIWGNLEELEGSHLKKGFLDLVIASNLFFQSENKPVIFKEAHRILRAGGRFIIIEWIDGQKLGPPVALRISRDTLKDYAAEAGFTFTRDFIPGSHHYGLEFQK